MIKLSQSRHDFTIMDARIEQLDYHEAVPFFLNPRGYLVHRVKSVVRLRWKKDTGLPLEPWWFVEYWCENSGRTDADDTGLLDDPGDRLICTRCEANAIAHGLPTSSDLVGRHVCTGTLRPVNVCSCPKGEN